MGTMLPARTNSGSSPTGTGTITSRLPSRSASSQKPYQRPGGSHSARLEASSGTSVCGAGMVGRAIELLQVAPADRVLDLYCGLGNFTLPLARRAASVVGVEGEAGLIERARSNARLNGIGNAVFHVADLSVAPDRALPWMRGGYDKVLLDPPRVGAAEVLSAVAHLGPSRVVYISCHTGSLARDLGELTRVHGFRLRAAGVLDMFPHTTHVESMAVLERVS